MLPFWGRFTVFVSIQSDFGDLLCKPCKGFPLLSFTCQTLNTFELALTVGNRICAMIANSSGKYPGKTCFVSATSFAFLVILKALICRKSSVTFITPTGFLSKLVKLNKSKKSNTGVSSVVLWSVVGHSAWSWSLTVKVSGFLCAVFVRWSVPQTGQHSFAGICWIEHEIVGHWIGSQNTSPSTQIHTVHLFGLKRSRWL